MLARSHDAKDIFINPLAWYEQNGVRLHAGARVTAVDREARTLTSASRGSAPATHVTPYDRLVMATGSVPFVPPMTGLEQPGGGYKPGVFVFRTLDDCEAISEYAQHVRVAAVIGGGLLGLEAARGLLEQGLEVHVVHLMPHLMEVQLDAPSGAVLRPDAARPGRSRPPGEEHAGHPGRRSGSKASSSPTAPRWTATWW